MKTSRACTGMLSYENNAFEFSETAKTTSSTFITCTIVRGLVELFFFFLQTSLTLTRNMNVTVAVELYYIFSKISKFGYW